MSQTTNTTPLSDETISSATELDALPNAPRPVLLGTYLKPDGASALIRTPKGKLQQVKVGDRIGQAQIHAIEMGRVHMLLLNQPHALTIPGKG
ncbi:MAG: hypothetical protein RIG84_19140 [Roseovarius sp.]